MENTTIRRVRYFSPQDLSLGLYADRVRLVLHSLKEEENREYSINDLIELYQCFCFVSNAPTVFEGEELDNLDCQANLAKSIAFKGLYSVVSKDSFKLLFSEIEILYREKFWDFFVSSGAFNGVSSQEFYSVLEEYPNQLNFVLRFSSLVKRFDKQIAGIMKRNIKISSELIISYAAAKNQKSKTIKLPKSLSTADIDKIIIEYLKSSSPNLNYVNLINNWPARARLEYRPSQDVRVLALKISRQLYESFLGKGIMFKYGSGVSISKEQEACKGIQLVDNHCVRIYGEEWLSSYMDYGTIMNNLIYVFEIVDEDGLLLMPAHKHEVSTIVSTLGLHSESEYPRSITFNLRNESALLRIYEYQHLLEQNDNSLEKALEWACNQHFLNEFNIDGFLIHIPSANASCFDKCKAIGPEIELLLKEFSVYVEKGKIETEYIPFINIKEFNEVPSLIKNKYAVEGKKFLKYSYVLFSDQSPLAYSEHHEVQSGTFFKMMVEQDTKASDFPSIYQQYIDAGFDLGLIEYNDKGSLKPTRRAYILSRIWEKGAIPIYLYSEEDVEEVETLIDLGCLSYSESLFTPDEADYFSYIFNNAKFSDSLGLRNRYDHGFYLQDGVNDESVKMDYYRLLLLLIAVVLKINDEFLYTFKKSGLEELIDWPLIDISSYKKAAKGFPK